MQVRESYDLIVIGDQLSGLLFAAGAAQSGQSVLVLENSTLSSIHHEVPSGKFLGDFAAEPVIGLQKDSKVDQFLKNLGLYQNVDDLFPEHNPLLQIITPKSRIDFSNDESVLMEEFKRENFAPELSKKFSKALLGNIVSKANWPQIAIENDINYNNETLAKMIPTVFGAAFENSLSYVAYKEVIDLAKKSVRLAMGGRAAIKERLMARIQIYGGTIKRSTWIDEVVFEKGRLAGALLSSYEGFVRSNLIVGAMGVKTFLQLIPTDFRSSKLNNSVKQLNPIGLRFSFSIMLPEEIVPEGLGSNILYFCSEPNLWEESSVHIQVFNRDVYGGVPGGHKALLCRVNVPLKPEFINDKHLQKVLRRAVDRVLSLIPNANKDNIQVSPNPESINADVVYQKSILNRSLEHIPPIHLIYENEMAGSIEERMDWSQHGCQGIALCSRDVRPHLGFMGEIFTAMDLLSLTEQSRKKKK